MKFIVSLLVASLALTSAFRIKNELRSSPIVPYSEGIEGRIVGGVESADNARPFQVFLRLTVGNNTYACGGSIISNDYILTAAHCTDGASEVEVTIGTNDVSDGSGLKLTSTDIKTHEDYGPIFLRNDLGVIRLPSSLNYSESINEVVLGSGFVEAGEEVRASGWGKSSDSSLTVTDKLRQVDVVTISNLACSDIYGNNTINAGVLCTSALGGKGVCSGDSGGPLTLISDGKQVGVASFVNSDGCESGKPHGFARVSNFGTWIFDNTGVSLA